MLALALSWLEIGGVYDLAYTTCGRIPSFLRSAAARTKILMEDTEKSGTRGLGAFCYACALDRGDPFLADVDTIAIPRPEEAAVSDRSSILGPRSEAFFS